MSPDEEQRRRARKGEEGDLLAGVRALREATRRPVRPFDAPEIRLPGTCEYCGESRHVKPESSRTMYHWDGEGENPNRDRILCEGCAVDHHEHWDEMWDSYYSGLF